jgi:hypothetical protein
VRTQDLAEFFGGDLLDLPDAKFAREAHLLEFEVGPMEVGRATPLRAGIEPVSFTDHPGFNRVVPCWTKSSRENFRPLPWDPWRRAYSQVYSVAATASLWARSDDRVVGGSVIKGPRVSGSSCTQAAASWKCQAGGRSRVSKAGDLVNAQLSPSPRMLFTAD